MDTLQKEKYKQITRRDHYDTLWKNIQLLLENNFTVKLNVVLIKGFNDSEIIDFINLTKTLNIQIRFIEFMPFNGNQWDKSKLVTYAEILEKVDNHFEENTILRMEDKLNDTARNHKIESFKGSFSVISSVTNPFCGTCNRIRLTADGKLKPCLLSNQEIDLKHKLRDGSTDEEISLILESTISMKPEKHNLDDDFFFADRGMSKIGG